MPPRFSNVPKIRMDISQPAKRIPPMPPPDTEDMV
jgi:hypothetical protein